MPKYLLYYHCGDPIFSDNPWMEDSEITAENEEEAWKVANSRTKETGVSHIIREA